MEVLAVVPMIVSFRAFTYGQSAPLFEEVFEMEDLMKDGSIERAVLRHAEVLEGYPDHVVEIEFAAVDGEPAEFFRIGTDPRMMVIPIPLVWSYQPPGDKRTATINRRYMDPRDSFRHFCVN